MNKPFAKNNMKETSNIQASDKSNYLKGMDTGKGGLEGMSKRLQYIKDNKENIKDNKECAYIHKYIYMYIYM